MDIDLKDFGITLAIGGMVIGLVLASLYVLFDCQPRGPLFNKLLKWAEISPALVSLFLVVAIFGLGIVGETLSNKMVDDDLFRSLPDRILLTEKEIRTRTLFGSVDKTLGSVSSNQEKVPSVARDLAATGRLSRFILDPQARAKVEEIEKQLLQPGITRQQIEQFVKGVAPAGLDLEDIAVPLYYTAKNTLILGHDNVAKELVTIQSRLDFCRSLAFYSICFLGINLSVIFLCGVVLKKLRPQWPPLARLHERYTVHGPLHRLGLCSVLAVLCYLTKHCYEAEEREFNIRTYGYFASLPEKDLPERKALRTAQQTTPEDISGAVRLDSGSFVIVRDAKAGGESNGPRAALLNPTSGKAQGLDIVWPAGEVMASDLEAICRVPGTTHILMCESGYYPKDSATYGRVFLCELQEDQTTKQWKLLVTKIWRWPPGTTDIEGLACVMLNGQRFLIAAQRAATSQPVPAGGGPGVLYWCPLDVDGAGIQLKFSNESQNGRTVDFPFLSSFERKISDLHVSSTGEVWACAAHEPKEEKEIPSQGFGPFKSAVYHLGRVGSSPAELIELSASPKVVEVAGFKVEALAAGSRNGELFIGTDDESLGGVWRFLDVNDLSLGPGR